jgi:hypothetical protein
MQSYFLSQWNNTNRENTNSCWFKALIQNIHSHFFSEVRIIMHDILVNGISLAKHTVSQFIWYLEMYSKCTKRYIVFYCLYIKCFPYTVPSYINYLFYTKLITFHQSWVRLYCFDCPPPFQAEQVLHSKSTFRTNCRTIRQRYREHRFYR